MAAMNAEDLNVTTMVALLGPALTDLILARIDQAGHRGVRASHGYVIQQLVDNQPTIGGLANALGMTQQGASKHVTDLESLGYVERVPDDQDQRVRTVRLTESGRALLEAGRRIQHDIETELTARIGATDLRSAKAALLALMDITGLDQHVGTRTVPVPS